MITVCGEGLVDLVPIHSSTNTNPRLLPLTPALGGGPFNVAITAARQGEPTQFLSRVSTDNFGDALVDRLTSENVDTSLVQRGQEPTTLAVTSLNPDGSASYSFYIDGTADRLVDPPADLTTDIACFGTVSLALEPGASRYAALLKNLHRDGTFIALDPNIRPFYATKAHSDFLYSLLPSVDLLKLSDEEEEFLDQPEAPIKVITCGPDGLIVHFNGQTIEVTAPTIEVADTIGAGDTVIGCLLAEIHRRTEGKNVRNKTMEFTGEDWAEIASYAARAAAVTCTGVDTNPPTRAEMEQLPE